MSHLFRSALSLFNGARTSIARRTQFGQISSTELVALQRAIASHRQLFYSDSIESR